MKEDDLELYRARYSGVRRELAIKVSSHEFTEQFEQEARPHASLNHPNICTLYDVGPNYLVMELVEGPTLDECIREGRWDVLASSVWNTKNLIR